MARSAACYTACLCFPIIVTFQTYDEVSRFITPPPQLSLVRPVLEVQLRFAQAQRCCGVNLVDTYR